MRAHILRMEKVCAYFNDVVQSTIHQDAKMKFYVYQREERQRQMGAFSIIQMMQGASPPARIQDRVVFSADFVIECPKFVTACCVHTVEDITFIHTEQTKEELIKVITTTLAKNPIIHDTLLYIRSDGFGHYWKDPLNEAQKKILEANLKDLEERKRGESWRGDSEWNGDPNGV